MIVSKEDREKDIIKEIRDALAQSQRERKKKLGRQESVQSSPYDISSSIRKVTESSRSSTSNLLTTVSTKNDTKIKKSKSSRELKKLLNSGKWNDTEELVNYYASTTSKNVIDEDVEVRVKERNQPYMESMVVISQFVESQQLQMSLHPELSADSNHQVAAARFSVSTTSVAASTDRMRKKYPRFSAAFGFNDALLNGFDEFHGRYMVSPRSDVWLARFMEDCYEEAFAACDCLVSCERWRLKNGLDLGSLDAFPLLVQRFIHKRFSVMEVRERVCVELLLTLELQMEASVRLRVVSSAQEIQQLILDKDLEGQGDVYNADRALTFSRFLSEDYDIDFLALYLQARNALQVRVLKIKLRHCIQERIWRGDSEVKADGERGLGRTATGEAKVAKGRKAHLLREVLLTRTAEDVPTAIAAGDSKKKTNAKSQRTAGVALSSSAELALEGKKVVPVSLPQLWHYAADLVMPESPLIAFEEGALGAVLLQLLPGLAAALRRYIHSNLLQHCRRHIARAAPAPAESPLLVPVALFLSFLCAEWKKVPLSSKLSALSTVSRASDSLRSLKDIYDRDCEMANAAEAAVVAAQVKLTEAQARQMQLDKALRRVERKWTAGVATEAELEKIQSLRKESSEARLNRLGRSVLLYVAAPLLVSVDIAINASGGVTPTWTQENSVRSSDWKSFCMRLDGPTRGHRHRISCNPPSLIAISAT
eukprot:gene24327-32765_t